MNREKQLLKIGIIIGIAMQMIQSIFMKKISILILIFLYIFIIIISILLKKTRICIGIILGYFVSYLIFMGLIYLVYTALFYFTKFYI